MENEGKHQRAAATTTTCNRVRETDFLLQWGNRKRLRCLKVKEEEEQHHHKDKDKDVAEKEKSNNNSSVIRKKITSRIDRRVVKTAEKDSSSSPSRLPPNPYNNSNNNNNKNCDRSRSSENLKQSSSPEKEERYYTTRGSVGLDENGKNLIDLGVEEKKAIVWPKLFISLSSKEKEEDFMAMKGCKLPQRPKKRAKFIQKNLLLVSPGAWLSDLCQERYEVREKKTSKKRPRGLKAMGSMESDSE
ncbi:putative Serine/Threonine-kinase [Thalictrum thalictroides]|uniref:Putative Serine/Threonine-kinase n=1 Tax=Thalictrum thalictroides TaxID=46969 RepID=A0A7J6V734_THATH|nr:putative Serine/Threonine-kinase [Thalictrum thalictroides]